MSGKGMALYVTGGALAVIGLIWGGVIGYYPHEAPFVIALLVIGAVLMFAASRIEAANKPTKVEWKPTTAPTTATPTAAAALPASDEAPEPPSREELASGIPENSVNVVDVTVAVPRRRRDVAWHAGLPDGTTVRLDQSALLGRAPVASADYPDARLIAVDDDSVSKTHAAFRVVDGALQIQDLQSANGTVLLAGDQEHRCPPGVWMSISDGATIELGAAPVHFSSTVTRVVS